MPGDTGGSQKPMMLVTVPSILLYLAAIGALVGALRSCLASEGTTVMCVLWFGLAVLSLTGATLIRILGAMLDCCQSQKLK